MNTSGIDTMSYYAGLARGLSLVFLEKARANIAYPDAVRIYVKAARSQLRICLAYKRMARQHHGS